MKKFLPFLSLLCALILWGCPKAPAEPDTLTPVSTTYSIGAEGGDISISFRTNLTYSVSTDASWLSEVTKTKAVETKSVTLRAAENSSFEARSATVTVKAGSLSVNMTVKQDGRSAQIDINTTSYEIAAAGGDVSVNVSSNVDYSVGISADWISRKSSASGSEVFSVAANESTSERSGSITFSYGSVSKTITIKQAAAEIPEEDTLENGDKSTYNVAAGGQNITVVVRSNVDYEVEVSDSWISQTKTKAVQEDRLIFAVAANTGAARTGSITITHGSILSFTVTVNQAAYVQPGEDPYLELSSHELSVGENGGTATLAVRSNYGYTVDSEVPWLAITSTGEIFSCTAEANPGEESRSTMLVFSSEGIVEYVNFTQLGQASGKDPFDVGSNLSVRGTANCYVVPKAGNYHFDASVMGNGPEGFVWEDMAAVEQNLWPWESVSVSFTNYGNEKPVEARVLWDDNNTITDVSMDANMVISFTATGNKGNALIAAYNKQRQLLWSWHIWCTDSPQLMRHDALDGTAIVMLDRNLGATSANPADGSATFGYWYQFGRKDPLKLFDGVSAYMQAGETSMQFAVENPTVIYGMVGKSNEWFNGSVKTITADLWGNPYALHNGADHLYVAPVSELRKTIYDPCPPGYMVPPEWAWDSFTMDDCVVSDAGLTFTVNNGETFYPFAGFGDEGDQYGGDRGWYGYPGFSPNSDGSRWHHNVRNVVACWASASANSIDRTGSENYQDGVMFYYLQNEEASGNTVKVNANSPAFFYPKYSHIRQRCCSVRCMRMFN